MDSFNSIGHEQIICLPPAFMIAGVRSGCGKTTLMLSLLAALQRRGITVQAFKAGPDFIDPMHHATITNKASYNLDTWLGEYGLMEKVFSRIVAKMQTEKTSEDTKLDQIIMVEGVMGLFDGAISKDNIYESVGTSAQLARRLNLPILLVVDAKGLAQSIAAIVHGYLSYEENLNFLGIVCTHVGSKKHKLMLEVALSQFNIPVLGFLPREHAPSLPSRHLGLMMPQELNLKINDLANYMEEYFDLEQLIDILQKYNFNLSSNNSDNSDHKHHYRPDNTYATDNTDSIGTADNTAPTGTTGNTAPTGTTGNTAPTGTTGNTAPCIAIAKDNAFCFLYPDFHDILRELNAKIVYFSPIHDQKIPNCQAIYIPGGYPELYAHQLSSNISMLESIKNFALTGGTIYGECGGYMYLMQEIQYKDTSFKMCQCLPCSCQVQSKNVALGYRSVIPYNDTFWGESNLEVRGHEFHYAKIISQENITPLWKVKDASGNKLADEGMQLGHVAGSWVHLYPESARNLMANFIQKL